MVAVLNMNKLTLCFLTFLVFSHVAGAQSKIELRSVDYDQWQTQLKQYQQQIVVVDFWATWCSSCLERFPQMIAMQNKFQDQGVQFVSMLLEDPEEPEAIERAKGFLKRQFEAEKQMGFDHYFMTENLMASFEKLDLIGIPAVFIYDRQSQLAHRLTGDNPNQQFTEADIEQTLIQMLNSNYQ